jgi:hypothetical protein
MNLTDAGGEGAGRWVRTAQRARDIAREFLVVTGALPAVFESEGQGKRSVR